MNIERAAIVKYARLFVAEEPTPHSVSINPKALATSPYSLATVRNAVPTIASAILTEFATKLLAAAGVPRDDADVVASSLVGSNLRGHDSHGVMRIPQYVDFVTRGDYRIGVELRVEHETAALVVCDAQFGLGQVQPRGLLELVLPKAASARRRGRDGARFRSHRPPG